MIRQATTEIIRMNEPDGLDYDVQTQINYEWIGKRYPDNRRWNDVVKQDGLKDFYSAVRNDQLPKPVVSPIRRGM